MNVKYLSAKKAALGLEEGTKLPPTKAYEEIEIGQRAMSGAELFSKTFDTPPEIIVRRSVLSLFEEYDEDYERVHVLLKNISALLADNKTEQVAVFLQNNPAIEWLNCIFLENEDIDEFAVTLEKSSHETRCILLKAVKTDLERLVNFKGLFEALLKKWKGDRDE